MRSLVMIGVVLASACVVPVAEDESTTQAALTADQLRARLELIRDAAAEMGVHNAALLAGIAASETNLAHCWSEATYACMGPASSSCAGGPIIAGSADGPCADMQGGLGMFQFDAGTYAQTVATYGEEILTVEGNTAQVVAFVIERLRQDVAGVDDWMTAADYLDHVPLVAGDPTTEMWADFLACRYNGCCSGSALCNSRAAGYRDNAIDAYTGMGPAFWDTASRCGAIPSDGVIAPRSACYVAGGEPRYWRREALAPGGPGEWTNTTASPAVSNFARWQLRPAGPTRVGLAVDVAGGTATTAAYRIVHAGAIDDVVVDQTQGGTVALGEFELAGTGDEYVELADNTGTAQQQLVFGPLRVTSLDGGGLGGDDGCGCRGGGGGGSGAGLVFALVALRSRRRRSARPHASLAAS